MSRNEHVEIAVVACLEKVDSFISGEKLTDIPRQEIRRLATQQLGHKSNSVKLASIFLVFYSLEDTDWNYNNIPTGIRGVFGDKKLATELTKRNITIHSNITAFGENLGWKGNVTQFQLSTDERFSTFISTLSQLNEGDRASLASFMAMNVAESRKEIKPLPPVGDDVLTFAKAKQLFYRLIRIPSEGHVQQFLIAAMLATHRARFGHVVKTHHPHASDKYDRSAGDIEEFRDGNLLSAYEVTVRSDWKNRIMDFQNKMDEYGLSKYVIIASNVNTDEELREPANLIKFISPTGRDIAIIDIDDLINVMSAELTANELRNTVNLAYDFLCQPKLCGRQEFIESFQKQVDFWLDGK